MKRLLFLLFALFALTNCYEEPEEPIPYSTLLAAWLLTNPNPDSPEVYFSSVRNLDLQVVYETGAEPEVGNLTSGDPYWSVTTDNLEAAFSERDYTVSVSVPTDLSGMTDIGVIGQSTWTISEILALSAAFKQGKSDYQTAKFFLAFVHGYLDNGGTPNTGVIGVNISGTPITIVFKDVIDANFGSFQKPRGEQITVSHELGHALGLVNNGVPMVTNHQDTANGNHCTNSACGMYYTIGGASGLSTFLGSFSDSSRVIFDEDCLTDFRSYKP